MDGPRKLALITTPQEGLDEKLKMLNAEWDVYFANIY